MAKKASKKSKGKENGKKSARQKKLPGMEDAAIEELESAAEAYVEVRDERMKLTEREVELKSDLMPIMRRHGKDVYRHGDVEIRIVPGEDDVKVRISKPKQKP